MARPPTPKTKAEVKAAVAGLKEALKNSTKALEPFTTAAKNADKMLVSTKKEQAKRVAFAEKDAAKAKAKLEKAQAAHAKGAQKINDRLESLASLEIA